MATRTVTTPSATILFAGGGTGGHIFPALAIAEACLSMDSSLACECIVSQRPLDARILHAQSLGGRPVRFHALPAQPAVLSAKGIYRFVTHWGRAVRAARAILASAAERGPVALVSTGGFVSAPVAQAARVERVPLVMVNLDAVPGKANRWIAKRAAHSVTALALAPHVPRASVRSVRLIRPIVRESLHTAHDVGVARGAFGLDAHALTLLITGGSQGAGSMNALLPHALAHGPDELRTSLAGWQVLHQCGSQENAEALRAAYANASIRAHVTPFIDRMDLAWRSASLALCRAGAGNVAEVWATGTPAVFLPYPYHRDMHQRWNAHPLHEAGAALLASDAIDPSRTLATLAQPLANLLRNEHARSAMRESLARLGPADGAQTVARLALDALAAQRPTAL
jgi:UDP-N-acetylglucosamine--N-acetylmuramyl-(pentapeptide) pyrophosphoryl-undecaprenol N-acetylglucosamine transferase